MAEEQKPIAPVPPTAPSIAGLSPAPAASVVTGPPTQDSTSVDELLNELDPEFKNQLGNLAQGLGTIQGLPNLESITLSADYLKEGAKIEEMIAAPAPTVEEAVQSTIAASKNLPVSEVVWNVIVQSVFIVGHLTAAVFKLAFSLRKKPPKEVFKEIPEVFSPIIKKWIVPLQAFVGRLKAFTVGTYIRLFIIVGIIFGIQYLVKDMRHRLSPDKIVDPFLKTWESVANHSYDIPQNDLTEDLLNPLRHPEYTVLIHKIIANLKTDTPRRSPMVSAELYIEASNQDCAIEIHERELEVRDLIERVFEESTFEDIDSKAGKERFKVRVRTALSHILNKGHIKRVFFSSINAAP